MPLTKLSTGLVLDGSISSAKITDGSVIGADIQAGTITETQLSNTLDLSTLTGYVIGTSKITHVELQGTYNSPADDDKFLQINNQGVLQWADPGTYPVPFTSLTGQIDASQIANDTITSAMITDLNVGTADIANNAITIDKLATTLDLSSSNLTFPATQQFTNVTITGDLIVQGTTTNVNTTDLNVKDRLIVLNYGEQGAGTSALSGIEIDRGSEQNAQIVWDDTQDKFRFLVGGTTAEIEYNFTFANQSVGLTQLDVPQTGTWPPPSQYFLESDGLGNVRFNSVTSSTFPITGVISGTLGATTFTPDSVDTAAINAGAVGPTEMATALDLSAKTLTFSSVTLNAINNSITDTIILNKINNATSFTLTNANLTLPTDSVKTASIQNNQVTVDKLSNTLDLSTKTVTLPSTVTFPSGSIDTLQLAVDAVTYDKIDFTNAGSNGQVLSLAAGNVLTWIPMEVQDPVWLGGFWPDVKENYSFHLTFSSGDMIVTMKNRDGNDLDTTQSLNSGYGRFAFRNANKHDSTYTIHKQTSNISITVPKAYGLNSLIGDPAVSTGWRRLYVYGYLIGGVMKLAISGKVAIDEGTTQNTVLFTSDTAPGLNNKLYGVDTQSNVPIRLLGRILAQNWSSASGWSSTNSDIELSVHFHTNQYEFV